MFETVRCWSLSFYESSAQLVLFFSLCVVAVKFWGITWWKRKSLPEIAMQIVTSRARSLSLRYGSYFGSWSMRMITWSNLTPSHETVFDFVSSSNFQGCWFAVPVAYYRGYMISPDTRIQFTKIELSCMFSDEGDTPLQVRSNIIVR